MAINRHAHHVPTAKPDKGNPEWTAAEIKKARPALAVMDEVFGKHATPVWQGLSAQGRRKINQTIRIDADVLAAYRQQGEGWQTRINITLREHMPPPK